MASQQCKIYKLFSSKGPNVYIGSTIQPLYKRMSRHRYEAKNDKNYTSVILFEEYENDVQIELIEEVTDDQRYIRERYWIENTVKCVNKIMPYHTEEEKEIAVEHKKDYKHERYLNKKKEDPIAHNKHACEIQKTYYKNNRKKILEKAVEYNKNNKELISEKNKSYHELHKDSEKYKAKNERLKEKIPCDICNVYMMRANMSRHKKLHHADASAPS